MALYEHVFLSRQDISAQQVEGIAGQYKSLIEQNGGKVPHIEHWGLRPIAYRLKKNRKAYYVLMNIDAPFSAIEEMERQMRINENILRYMTISVDAHEEGPSIMMQKRDREEKSYKSPREHSNDRKRVYREEKQI
ncbi:SSU ribosomal protein S6p [Liberibacter crescens BT-1]|uniref:Small ribosomal subunit protein bS6 n=1 Tax=Liberibacter crescens (strain BT-1) TaxID=1215343 RepID=L0ES37_LIBCB|nr:SSU ribosomal protein S6p [Liberibacter crescens BT-1]AMC12527.1 30S ribosomal protein S6 [Liberibacter crescens]